MLRRLIPYRRPDGVPAPGFWAHRSLAPLVGGASLIAFLVDITTELPLAAGVLYVPAILTAAARDDRRWIVWAAIAASVATLLGFWFPYPPVQFEVALVNRGLSLLAILCTALFLLHERRLRAELLVERSRSESASRAKTELLHTMSHELRTPLNAVIGFAELLDMDCRDDQRESLQFIRQGGTRLLGTIETILDFTALDQRSFSAVTVDLAVHARQAISAVTDRAAEARIELRHMSDPSTSFAAGDAWAIRRILRAVLDNALKFTPAGGIVTVSVLSVDGRPTLQIDDTGPGIPMLVLDRLGEPFYQGNASLARGAEGIGLGLALCMALAARMDAELLVERGSERGTSLQLRLRAAGRDDLPD